MAKKARRTNRRTKAHLKRQTRLPFDMDCDTCTREGEYCSICRWEMGLPLMRKTHKGERATLKEEDS